MISTKVVVYLLTLSISYLLNQWQDYNDPEGRVKSRKVGILVFLLLCCVTDSYFLDFG